MQNAGTFALASLTITSAITQSQTPILNLDGATALTLFARLAWGSGGTSIKADVETSLDDGATWLAFARFAFTTANASKVLAVSGLTQILAAYTPIALTDDTALGGILGDRVRATVTSLGTYAGSTLLDVRMSAR